MPNYRRRYQTGGIYFFTVVTYHRKPIFSSTSALELFQGIWNDVNVQTPFSTLAFCILPDHIHCVWKLPEGDSDFSTRWKLIKARFSISFSSAENHSDYGKLIWEERFWEHLIVSDDDLHKHIDYIHFNPIKHRFVDDIRKWPYSSFQTYLSQGYYDENWGTIEPENIKNFQAVE